MQTRRSDYDLRRLTWLISGGIAVAAMLLVAIIALTGWNANSSEAEAELARIENGLNRGVSRILDQQKSVAWWDQSIQNVVINFDADFVENNFGLFLTETYGHDEIFILDGSNEPVFAYDGSGSTTPDIYYRHRDQISGLIEGLRNGSAGGLRDRPDTFGADQRTYDVLRKVLEIARWKGNILLVDGKPAIVAGMTIVPNEDVSLYEAPPYLLVSLVWLDDAYISELGRSLLLPDLALRSEPLSRGALISAPFLTDGSRNAGYLAWTTKRPGHVLLTVILPLVIVGLVATAWLAMLMLRQLRRASAELAEREEKATYLATHDTLSTLPNRYHFVLKVDELLDAQSPVILGYLDIDRFKEINDTMGHHAGDELIKSVALRLSHHLGENSFIARFGGDEFAIVCALRPGASQPPLESLLSTGFDEPFSVYGQAVKVTASLGLASAPEDGGDSEALMRSADIALYEAKRLGRDRSIRFSPEMAARLEERRRIELELRGALARDELELHYQPIISCLDMNVVGLEALLRWDHPQDGMIPPMSFIPVVEEAGLMPELGAWVLRRAMNDSHRWPGLDIAINLSPAQFHHFELDQQLRRQLKETGADPARITLEITESVLLADDVRTRATLEGIRELGFKFALDDFGTGFSSLKYLLDFKFNKLKIDRSFVRRILHDTSAKAIVRSVIDLGRSLELEVIAEGVESGEEAIMMRFLNCHAMQGYYFSKGLPAEEVDEFLLRMARERDLPSGAQASLRR